MSKLIDDVKTAIEPVVVANGCEIVDIEYKKQYGQMNLTVFIWNEAGVSLDDCERVHNAIDPVLDELDPTGGESYVLNVSSPGLDRPIVTERDFERAKNTKVTVSLYAKRDGKKKFDGLLVGLDENKNVIVEIGSEKIIFNKDEVAAVKPVIEF